MNYNNLSTPTNWSCGSTKLKLGPIYLQEFSIPGISFSHPQIYNHNAGPIFAVADNITFNELSCNILLDEDFKVYFELMKLVFDQFNPENGSFANQEFDWFVEMTNQKGNKIFSMNFYHTRIESIGDVSLSTQGDDAFNTLNLGLKYDYFLIDNLKNLADTGLMLVH